MFPENVAGQPERFVGQDRNALAVILHRDRPPDPQVAALSPVIPNPGAFDQIDEGLPAAIENRHLQVIDLDERVVDAHAVEHAQQMFSGRDQNALPHQAGGVADPRYIAPTGWDREVVQVRAQEYDAGRYRSGQDSNRDGNSTVQSDSTSLGGALNRRLKTQLDSLPHAASYQLSNRVFLQSSVLFSDRFDLQSVAI